MVQVIDMDTEEVVIGKNHYLLNIRDAAIAKILLKILDQLKRLNLKK